MRTTIRAGGALGVLALLVTGTLSGQTPGTPPIPRIVHGEVVNWDFSPDGAFRKVARGVRSRRAIAMAQGDLSFLNGVSPSSAVTGNFRLPVVMVEFSDTVATGFLLDTAAYNRLLFSTNPAADNRPYSVKTFYEQISDSNITIAGDIYGWVRVPQTKAFVGQNCYAIGANGTTCPGSLSGHLGAMLIAALDSLNKPGHQVDWSLYDSDHDGVVDFVSFIDPGLGGECVVSKNDLWAHRYNLVSLRGSSYTTATPYPGHPGLFIHINDYIIQSGRGGNTGCSAGTMMPIGTTAHETGHAFGLPDLYDLSNATEGIGEWGLMGAGNYARPYSPSSMEAWSKAELGWVTVDTLSSTQTVTLGPVQTSDTVLVAHLAGSDEYLLLENRQAIQSDSAMMNAAFSRQKLPGLLPWLVDLSIMNSGNNVNTGPIKGLRLLQADGLRNLDSIGATPNRGDVGDSYPGSTNNHRLTYTTNPSMRTNEGTQAGFVIDSIQQVSVNGPMIFRFRKSAPYRVLSNAIAKGGKVTVNGVTDSTYEEIFALGDSIHLSVADTQLVNSNRTKLVFGSWSDGLAQSHTVVSDGTPDTVTATLNSLYKVVFTPNGAGTVGTSGPTSNSFVASGAAVTLTATPNGGQSFTNWTGDTTTGNAVLVLPMTRPYTVTANFSGAVTITFPQARDAILGISTLSGPQITYLDGQGNNDGVYDLGDFLSYLKANAIIPSPELMQRVLAATARPLTSATER